MWRALLPHAIANRLAVLALDKLLPEDLERFWKTSSPRLLRSFSRRLGYLHTSERAQRLVETWLSPAGFLGTIEGLNDLTTAVLVNVAPVAPSDTLNAIARASGRERESGRFLKGEEFRTLLRSLAFESQYFERAFDLLIDLVEHEEPSHYGLPGHYHYKEVAKQCLARPGDGEIVSNILHRVLAAAIPGFGMSFYDAPVVIEAMVNVQPVVALDTIFANRSTTQRAGMDSLLERYDISALDCVPEALLFEWCDRDRTERYPWLASKISIFKKINNAEVRQWNEVALALLERSPDPLKVMRCYVKELEPMSWSGSRAIAWEANASLLDSFETHQNSALVAFVKEKKRRVQQSIAELRIREEAQERQENERFE